MRVHIRSAALSCPPSDRRTAAGADKRNRVPRGAHRAFDHSPVHAQPGAVALAAAGDARADAFGAHGLAVAGCAACAPAATR